jgi:hypothetical protein
MGALYIALGREVFQIDPDGKMLDEIAQSSLVEYRYDAMNSGAISHPKPSTQTWPDLAFATSLGP